MGTAQATQAKMQQPQGPEVSIWNLVPGEHYTAFSNQRPLSTASSQFGGIFTEYWTNEAGYSMVRFHYTKYTDTSGYKFVHGSPEVHPHGLYFRIFEHENPRQSYSYYKTSRFTKKEGKELSVRVLQRERRQYERGLTGSTADDIWFPRDLVREISLKYLTDSKIGCKLRSHSLKLGTKS